MNLDTDQERKPQMRVGFDSAMEAIKEGKAVGHALWMILSYEHDRDGYWLKPMPWEGPGEYQRISYDDGREGLIRLPDYKGLPCVKKDSA